MKKSLVLFLAIIFSNSIWAQNQPNDCVNAIVVCGNGNFSSNASGIGNVQEVSGCGGFEHNSIWLKINIVQSGTLGFDLIPNNTNIAVDYDFWVFGPNQACSALSSPIRCATSNPQMLNASNNHTGMSLSSSVTEVGPGVLNPGNGDGYVRSINVTAGQFYYIAVDRPVGDGGFEIQWTGTAMANGGAFPTPPIANQIPELRTCSNTPNVGIFDLNAVRSQINPNLVANTISFYTTLANATDGISPLPNIIANTSNPQKIYAKVVNNVSGCYTIIDFNLRVYPVPSANISISDTQICSGQNVTVTFTGTPGATVGYRLNNGPVQTILLNTSGTFQITGSITANTTYALVSAKILDTNNATVCSQAENDTVSVTVSTVATPTLTTNSPICEGDVAVLTFSGLANAVITYTVNSGTPQTVTLNGSGQQQVNLSSLPVGSNQITLSNITDSNAPNCSQTLNITETVLANEQITAGVLVTPNVCQGAVSPQITFTGLGGNPPYTFVYNINAGPDQTVTTITGNSISLNVPTNSPGTFTYNVVSVNATNAPTCIFPQTGTATVTIGTLPSITGTLSLCQGSTSQLTGSGTPAVANAWTSDNPAIATVSNAGLVTGISAGTAIITFTGNNGCPVTATVTVNGLPIISGTISTCLATTSQLTISESPSANTWSSSNPGVATVSATGLVSAISQGTSTITYTDTKGCLASTVFTVYTAPNILGSNVICSNETSQLTGSGTPAVTNPWLSGNTGVATVDANGLVRGISAGSAIITYSDSNGCSNTITITVNALPTINGTLFACQGLTTQLTGSGASAVANVWVSSNTAIATVNTTGLVFGVAAGTATITYTNNNGCLATATVTINPLPTISGTLTACMSATTQLTGQGIPAAVNSWVSSNTAVATVNAAGLVTGISAGTATITYTNANGCFNTAIVTVLVAPTASISNLGSAVICSGSAANIQITGTPGATVNYTVNSNAFSDVIPGSGIITIASTLTVTTTFSIVNIVNGGCTSTIAQSVTVNVTPMPSAVLSYNGPFCVTESTLQPVTFLGTAGGNFTVNPLAGLNINPITGAILPSASTPGIYQVTYNVAASGGCPLYTSASVTVTILNGPTATISYGVNPFCVSQTGQVNVMQTGTTGGNYSAIPSGLSIDNVTGAITPNSSTPGIYTVYYKIAASGGCPELIREASVTILDIPKPNVNAGVLCINALTNIPFSTATLNSGLNSQGLTFEWYFNGSLVGSSNTFEASQTGAYTLTVTNAANCSVTVTTSVTAAYPALDSDATYVVSNYFEDNQTITIHVVGSGSYLYSLDNGPFQESNVFAYVSPGEHSVTIHDENGCTDITIKNIITIDYPHFFTPNADGYHDTWNIWSLRNQQNAEIHIFDRYGKLIKMIKPEGSGWDGTFNGQELPSTDYWFTIKYDENQVEKIFKSHFSLKR